VPLLVIYVWEHAYYLKHKNKRDQFVDTLRSAWMVH
jgi:superoxide dismutase, Fe-Mn family